MASSAVYAKNYHPVVGPCDSSAALSGGSSDSREQRRRLAAADEALREQQIRVAQMERTLRWWSDCTQGWRDKWRETRQERNNFKLEANLYRLQLGQAEQKIAELLHENSRLVEELEKERLLREKKTSDAGCQVNLISSRPSLVAPSHIPNSSHDTHGRQHPHAQSSITPPSFLRRPSDIASRIPSSSHSAPSHLSAFTNKERQLSSGSLKRNVRRNLSLDAKSEQPARRSLLPVGSGGTNKIAYNRSNSNVSNSNNRSRKSSLAKDNNNTDSNNDTSNSYSSSEAFDSPKNRRKGSCTSADVTTLASHCEEPPPPSDGAAIASGSAASAAPNNDSTSAFL